MLTWFAQEFDSSCVAACVRMVLNGLGDSRDEAQVRQLIGYTPLGVSLAQAQARLDDPSPRSYSVAAFTGAWEEAGREALLIEAPPTS